MLSHLRVSGERETTSCSHTMKMFVDRIAAKIVTKHKITFSFGYNVTVICLKYYNGRCIIIYEYNSRCLVLHSLYARLQSAVDRTIEKQKSLHDGHVVVEMRRVSLQLFVVVGGEKASGSTAMVV